MWNRYWRFGQQKSVHRLTFSFAFWQRDDVSPIDRRWHVTIDYKSAKKTKRCILTDNKIALHVISHEKAFDTFDCLSCKWKHDTRFSHASQQQKLRFVSKTILSHFVMWITWKKRQKEDEKAFSVVWNVIVGASTVFDSAVSCSQPFLSCLSTY